MKASIYIIKCNDTVKYVLNGTELQANIQTETLQIMHYSELKLASNAFVTWDDYISQYDWSHYEIKAHNINL